MFLIISKLADTYKEKIQNFRLIVEDDIFLFIYVIPFGSAVVTRPTAECLVWQRTPQVFPQQLFFLP
jgi:hypothetical protein